MTETFDILREILAQIGQVKPSLISPETNLVKDLKLDSLMRVELVAEIEERLAMEIDEAEIGPKTKVEDLEKLIQERQRKKIKHKLASWQLHVLTRIVRKLLQKVFVFPGLVLFAPITVMGRENLKDLENPVIFMSNHTCSLDSVTTIKALPSKFRDRLALPTATDIIYEKFKWARDLVILLLNIYPFPRIGQIKTGLDYTQKLIDEKYSILFYPEGKESISGEMDVFKRGAGFLAVQAGCPVVPVRIRGAREIIPPHCHFPRKRGRISINFGSPLYFKKNMASDEATEIIKKAIKNL